MFGISSVGQKGGEEIIGTTRQEGLVWWHVVSNAAAHGGADCCSGVTSPSP
jgi:hypothetical protein